jgi:hypothetical protein
MRAEINVQAFARLGRFDRAAFASLTHLPRQVWPRCDGAHAKTRALFRRQR